MNKNKIFLIPVLATSLLSGCKKEEVKSDVMFFSPQLHLTSNDFDGLGVEWGAYEDTNKVQTNYWERVTKYADRMNGMALVRCMVSYDWFCEDFDDKGDNKPKEGESSEGFVPNKTNDTWTYNFTNKYMRSTEDVLTYCQLHDIDVAFGAWNVVAAPSFAEDIWGMMDDVTSDPRWAKMTADVLEYLVQKKGFTCIKYFVNSNEPNYLGQAGKSKNANNSFEKWRQGVLNVRAILDSIGLTDVKIVGSDATFTSDGSAEYYLQEIAKDPVLRDAVGDYGFHVYAWKRDVDNGNLLDNYRQKFDEIKSFDEDLGVVRKPHIWEGGLQDGKDITSDCQKLITEYSYANLMVDYTIQALASGINGITYWDFDDAMHFMYNADGTVTPKEWGMFSTLSSATVQMQELRPWYHSSMLLMNLFRRHNIVFDSGNNVSQEDPNFRSIATISNDKKLAGVVFSNNKLERKVKFVIDEKYENDEKMYVYVFGKDYTLIGEDGFIVPNYEINGSMNKITELTIPTNSVVVVSNKVL